MEGVGAEVTQKLRNAIKNKLTELGAYVDEELPEYVMVMVANKKNKLQMEEDLSLFLGSSTTKFSSWLHEVLNNLQSISVETNVPAPNDEGTGQSAKMNFTVCEEKLKTNFVGLVDVPKMEKEHDNSEVENDEVLALKVQEQDSDDPLIEELKEDSDALVTPKMPEEVKVVPSKNIETSIGFDTSVKTEEKLLTNRQPEREAKPKAVKIYPFHQKLKTPCSTVMAVKKTEHISADEEYDPHNPSVGSVASIVRVSERRPSVPPSLQANKLLLLKAVEDANKSVMSRQRLYEYYKPSPIKDLSVKSRGENTNKLSLPQEEQVQELDLRTFLCSGNLKKNVPVNNAKYFETNKTDDILKPVCLCRTSKISERPVLQNNQTFENLHFQIQTEISTTVSDTPEEPVTDQEVVKTFLSEKDTEPECVTTNSSPRFVVTLDGVDPKSFLKRKRSFSDRCILDISDKELSEDCLQEDEVDNKVEDNATEKEVTEKKQKVNERCRYWPACKNGDQCPYHHPTISCKAFPNCKYGDKCLYIHPNCKFDALCTRKDCPYTHASKRNLPTNAVSVGKPYFSRPACKYFPNCSSKNCPFLHPKLCQYGSDCHIAGCTFSHPSLPSRSQLKWTSNSVVGR